MSQFRYTTPQWWVAITALIIVMIGPGNIEGRLFPAAAPMVLEQYEASQDSTQTKFWGSTARLRPSCSFEKIIWYLGERGGRYVPVSVTLGPPKVREDGAFDFGPWSVDIIPPESLKNYSFADVYHHCSLFGIQFPWLTRSIFWN